MSKFSKYVVLSAGLIGIIAFFMPLIAVKDSGVTGKLSAFQIVKGLDKAQDVVGEVGKEADAAGLSKGVVKDANAALAAVKGIVMAVFFPALMLLVFGVAGTLRKSFGRVLGSFSIVFGLLGLGIWALLSAAASEAGGSGGSVAGIGMHLLLLTGLGGAVGGLMATIKPERRAPRTELAPTAG